MHVFFKARHVRFLANCTRCRAGSGAILVSVKKHSSGLEDPGENQRREHRIRAWRAASAAGLQGRGSRKRIVFSQTAVSCRMRPISVQNSEFQRVWLRQNLNLKGWDSHVHRESPGNLESTNLSWESLLLWRLGVVSYYVRGAKAWRALTLLPRRVGRQGFEGNWGGPLPGSGVWTRVDVRVWTCEGLRVKRDRTGCYSRPPFLGTPLAPSRGEASTPLPRRVGRQRRSRLFDRGVTACVADVPYIDRESIEVRESTRVVLGNVQTYIVFLVKRWGSFSRYPLN